MTGSIETLLAAAVCFIGSHFLLSSRLVRPHVVGWLGERGFLGMYSGISTIFFVWLIFAYIHAPYVEIWPMAGWMRHVPFAVMPLAVLLVVCGYMTPNPTAVGGERAFEAPDPTPGIFRITRHPVMWGIGLWALVHLLANGDQASIILFGGLAILAFGGMLAIDAKRAERLGAQWGPVAISTSLVPFLAIIEGRTSFDWPGIGWRKLGVAVIVLLLLILGHPYFAGVPLTR